MKNFTNRFLVWFAVVAVVVFLVGAGLRAGDGAVPTGSGVELPGGDISVLSLPDGDEVVMNTMADYRVTVPSNWYVEHEASDTRLAVYPDYNPTDASSSSAATCKIEFSVLVAGSGPNPATAAGLSDWVTQYLHADPTANVAEISRTPIAVGDPSAGDGSSSVALQWRGILNSVTTTLVYAAMPAGGSATSGDSNNNILEIAPSTLSEASDADNDDCEFDLQALVANLKFGAYEP